MRHSLGGSPGAGTDTAGNQPAARNPGGPPGRSVAEPNDTPHQPHARRRGVLDAGTAHRCRHRRCGAWVEALHGRAAWAGARERHPRVRAQPRRSRDLQLLQGPPRCAGAASPVRSTAAGIRGRLRCQRAIRRAPRCARDCPEGRRQPASAVCVTRVPDTSWHAAHAGRSATPQLHQHSSRRRGVRVVASQRRSTHRSCKGDGIHEHERLAISPLPGRWMVMASSCAPSGTSQST